MSIETSEIVTENVIANTGASEGIDTLRVVKTNRLKIDKGRNPRKHREYTPERLSPLARSVLANGLQEPPTVSERSDGSLHVLKGHRRLTAILMVQETGIPKDVYGPEIAPRPDFMTSVKVRVIKGLTMAGEIDILMDHGDVKKLDKQEKLQAARTMVNFGLTHELIAQKLGGSRANYTNGIAKVLALPPIVEMTYLSEEDNAPSLTQPTLKDLHTAYKKDLDTRASSIKEEGPAFKAAWEHFIKHGTNVIKVMPRKEMLALAGNQADPDVRNLLAALASNDKSEVGTILESLTLRLTDLTTVNTGFVRVEEGIETTVRDFQPVE